MWVDGGGIGQVEAAILICKSLGIEFLCFTGELVGSYTKTLKACEKRYCYLEP